MLSFSKSRSDNYRLEESFCAAKHDILQPIETGEYLFFDDSVKEKFRELYYKRWQGEVPNELLLDARKLAVFGGTNGDEIILTNNSFRSGIESVLRIYQHGE